MEIFGSSGVRGGVNAELSPEYVLRIAAAAGSRWRMDDDRVAVGTDTRTSREMFAAAAVSGLTSVGLAVDRLGIVPTPALQAYAERETIPAVMITASHNPPSDNGVKLIGRDGVELPRGELEAVEDRFFTDRFERASWDDVGETRSVEGIRASYVDGVLTAVDRSRIASADLTVAIDPGHGAGSLTSPQLFRELGCRVLTINAQPDGHFPGRDPEPVADRLGDLSLLVETTDADLGIAHDGDADRAIFLDETGSFIEGDAVLAALIEARIQAGDRVVSAVSASRRLDDVIEAAGGRLHRTAIGSTNIVTKIKSLVADGKSVPIAGEGNGGIIFPEYRIARDGAFTAARFCELLADRSASQIAEDVGGYENVRRTVGYDTDEQREAMIEAIASKARESVANLTTIDGYRLDFGDGWVLARPSGTEPLIRVYAEARSRNRAEDLADEMVRVVERARETI